MARLPRFVSQLSRILAFLEGVSPHVIGFPALGAAALLVSGSGLVGCMAQKSDPPSAVQAAQSEAPSPGGAEAPPAESTVEPSPPANPPRGIAVGEPMGAGVSFGDSCEIVSGAAPVLSEDGVSIYLLQRWASCCADMARLSHEEFIVPPPGGVQHMPAAHRLICEYDLETHKKLLGKEESAERTDKVNKTRTERGAHPLETLSLSKDGTFTTALSTGEQLRIDAAGITLKKGDEVQQDVRLPPFDDSGFCCTGEMPERGKPAPTCTHPATVRSAFIERNSRVVVLSAEFFEGADGCEQGPRFTVIRLPLASIP
jgi:hypothetical protein